jgi:hypothetical protein
LFCGGVLVFFFSLPHPPPQDYPSVIAAITYGNQTTDAYVSVRR